MSEGVAAPEFVGSGDGSHQLTLFVSGGSDLSARAIANARRLCEMHLDGRYHLSIVDIHEDPAAVRTSRVRAAPTLVQYRPLPVRRVVGDLSDTDRVLLGLGIRAPTDVSRTR